VNTNTNVSHQQWGHRTDAAPFEFNKLPGASSAKIAERLSRRFTFVGFGNPAGGVDMVSCGHARHNRPSGNVRVRWRLQIQYRTSEFRVVGVMEAEDWRTSCLRRDNSISELQEGDEAPFAVEVGVGALNVGTDGDSRTAMGNVGMLGDLWG
jgi:hypothetical protein